MSSQIIHADTSVSTAAINVKVSFDNGALELLKWLALIMMTIDHINAAFYHWKVEWMFDVGRLVMPTFGFILAYNLCREGAMERGVHIRTMTRLAIFGVIASPAYAYIHGIEVINILFTLLLFTFITFCIEKKHAAWTVLGVISFVVCSAFVEFWWFGVFYCLAAWMVCKKVSVISLTMWLIGGIGLFIPNQNWWALLAMPLLIGGMFIKVRLYRDKYLFYAYYPLHLSILAGLVWLRH